MKKFLAILLALSMVLSLAACASTDNKATEAPTEAATEEVTEEPTVESTEAPTEEPTEAPTEEPTEAPTEEVTEEPTEEPTEAPAKPMTHAEYMAAELDSEVYIETYVQAHQSWWEGKITVYGQSEDGAYFIYNMACTEEDAAKLVPGTKILVKGVKAEWSGEVEIVDATFEIAEGSFIAEPVDVTELLGKEELIDHQNELVAVKGLTVEKVEYKNGEPGDDIYVTFEIGELTANFCVEAYLTGPDSDVYAAVGALNVGDVVDVEGFLYWYNGANTHMTKVTVVTPAPVAEPVEEAAKIPVKVYNNKNATIEVYDYVKDDASTLENTADSVAVGNYLAVKVTPAEGYAVAHVRVNSKSVQDCENGYWLVEAKEGTKSFAVKALLTQAEANEEDAAEEPVAAEVAEAVPDETVTETPVPGVITKVALVTDVGTIDDESFNQACWQGVEAWCKANDIAYTYYQPTEDSTDARVLSVAQAVEEGANAIVMPGYLFGTTVLTVQDEFPDVYFIAVDVAAGDLTFDYSTFYDPNANVACMTFSEEQAGYLAGYAAVKEGYTKLGFLGGMAVPAVIRYGYGFVQGADAAAKEMGVEVTMNYTYGGQFFGSPEITAKMEGWYQKGTEVVFACGGGIYTSALEAAEKNGGKVIGVDVDQSHISPLIITSAMKQLQNVTELMLDTLNKGQWETYGGKVTNFGLMEGEYVGLPTATWSLENFSVEDYEALKEQIRSGEIEVSNATEAMPEVSITVNEIA